MTAGEHDYRSTVTVLGVRRDGGQESMSEITTAVSFHGGFEAAFSTGDNAAVLPTHTMSNTVTALLPDYLGRAREEFVRDLAEHFLDACPAVRRVRVSTTDRPWEPLRRADGSRSPHAYAGSARELRTAAATADRDGATVVSGGVSNLWLGMTTGSSFTGFLRDAYTTKAEQYDRPMEAVFALEWEYRAGVLDYAAARDTVRETVPRAFAEHTSLSSQHTLHVLGSAVVAACPEVASVRLTCLAHDHPLVDLSPFGRANDRQVYAAPRVPCSLTHLTVASPSADEVR
ncbi:factor-independent urate hydroxylase [Streptomyces niveiscabiei]|uniref:Uricase n=1 Tax=Streptomyces niveiscabiei TaxID=164115 RepID=A0ABW9HL00_9ACTN